MHWQSSACAAQHSCCSGFLASTNSSVKQFFTYIQVSKLFDTQKVFSLWHIRMIVHFFVPSSSKFSSFYGENHVISTVNSLLKLKYIPLSIFQKQNIIILCYRKWKFDFLKKKKKALEAPNHLIVCGCLKDFIPCKLWSGHWLPQLFYLLVGLWYNSNNISNIFNGVW